MIKYTRENMIEHRIDRILEQKHSLFRELVDDLSLYRWISRYYSAATNFSDCSACTRIPEGR